MNRVLPLSLVILMVTLLAGTAQAANREEVDQSIQRGVKYLKTQQLRNGHWAHQHIGATALAGLTLLECGVPADDPAVQRAADAVRSDCPQLSYNYSLSLVVLFLDRLGEPTDVPLIQALGVRLLSGQTAFGTWSYYSAGVPVSEVRRLTEIVRARNKLAAAGKLPKADPERNDKRPVLPQELRAQIDRIRRLPPRDALKQPGGAMLDRIFTTGDNSNTQFAILALWIARRHGVPVEDFLARTEKNFRDTQNPDGGWGYLGNKGGFPPGLAPESSSTPAMTCSGLLGLATGFGARNEAVLRTRGDGKPAPGGDDPETDPGKDPIIRKALHALSGATDSPAGGDRAPRIGKGSGKVYYFLWSLERVAVIYDLETIGKRNWYEWGTNVLLANQDASGGWINGEFHEGCCDTSFALLFLVRANLAKDLTRVLSGRVQDPARVELTAGGVGGSGLKGGPKKLKPIFEGPEEEPPAKPEKPIPKSEGTTDAAKLGASLAEATGADQERILATLRDGKGGTYTLALTEAINQLEGDAKTKARQALADRLTRMTAGTLARMLEDKDAELRRASALACAMKDEKDNFEKIIDLLGDSDFSVARAAYASLKALSGRDFGPTREATPEETARAIMAWKTWWKSQQDR